MLKIFVSVFLTLLISMPALAEDERSSNHTSEEGRTFVADAIKLVSDHVLGNTGRRPEAMVTPTTDGRDAEAGRRARFEGDIRHYRMQLEKAQTLFEKDLEVEKKIEAEEEELLGKILHDLDFKTAENRVKGSVSISLGLSTFLHGSSTIKVAKEAGGAVGALRSMWGWGQRIGGGVAAANQTQAAQGDKIKTDELRQLIADKRKQLDDRSFRIGLAEGRLELIKKRLASKVNWTDSDIMEFVREKDLKDDQILEAKLRVAGDKAGLKFLDDRIASVKAYQSYPGYVSLAAGGVVGIVESRLGKGAPGVSTLKATIGHFGLKAARNAAFAFGATESYFGYLEQDELVAQRNTLARHIADNDAKVTKLEKDRSLFARALEKAAPGLNEQ